MIFIRYIRKIILGIFIFFFLQGNSSFARDVILPDENNLIDCFFRNLYNFSFDEADSLVVVMNNSNIDNVTISNIKANLAWWKLLSGDSIETNLKICNFNIDESIRLSLKINRPDINSLLNLIYSYSLKARLENYRGNTLKSFICFYKSTTYIEKCVDSSVDDERLNLVLGLYLYLMDYIENEYHIMRVFFLSIPSGDKNKGLKYLENCSTSANEMIRTEANYFLLKIYTYTEKDYSKAYTKAQLITQQHPHNLVYSLEQLKLLLKMKKSAEALIFQKKLIEEIQIAKNINSFQKNHFISQIMELTKPSIKYSN